MGTSTQYTSVRKKNERSKQKQRRQRLNGLVQNRNQRKHKKDLGKEKQLKGSLGVSISASYAAMNIL